MTANELANLLNIKFDITKEWPKTYEVDHETYASCCQAVFNHVFDKDPLNREYAEISLGPNKGLMFKNVELIFTTR